MKYIYILLSSFLLASCMSKEEKAIRKYNEAYMESTGTSYGSNTLKYDVEDLKVDKSNKYVVTVSGMVRNNSSYNITGHVKIKFLSSNGDVKKTALAMVNDNDPIAAGRAANFKYSASPNDFSGVTNFEVIFVEK